MKNIHVLPTDKPSRLHLQNGNLVLHRLQYTLVSQHIYITNDEEIKVNEYITDGYKVWQWKDDSSLLGRKKIILTTDQDLIKEGVQAIDDEFLEWFVKNPSCEWVEVEYGDDGNGYQVIIPKEETKQETLEVVAEKESEYLADWEDKDMYKKGFIDGAKWQQQNKNLYSEEEVRNLLIECCGEVSCEDGALIGKSPTDLVKWIDTKFKKK